MAIVRLFAGARQAAGTGRDQLDGRTVAEVVEAATRRYGPAFAEVLVTCKIWVNGESADPGTVVTETDEVAFLPPVSGGAGDDAGALTLEELRARRARLQDEDDIVSYARRIAQARLDLVRNVVTADDSDELTRVLSQQLIGGAPRPPRPVEIDPSDSPLMAELDRICAEGGFSRLADLDEADRAALAGQIEAFEARVSADRRARFSELDALNAELVRRYRSGEATIE